MRATRRTSSRRYGKTRAATRLSQRSYKRYAAFLTSSFWLTIVQRFKSYHSSNDIESLGHLCSILYEHEHAIDILSLHVNMQDLLAHALAIVEDYDCETVGM